MTACYCQSGKDYTQCCEPFHLRDKIPETAEQLMRSRYSAYRLVNIAYIVETTVPNQRKFLAQRAMKEWGESTKWAGLHIVKHLSNLSKIHSQVEFKAFFETEDGRQVHHEISLFVKIEYRWFFVDPTVPLPNQKQSCICSSGKKFKHCCGYYL
ncbi:YchJ family protein [Mannheimia pernigra]|uniref:YchJ family protein n=1 Tax=Mannheimia pernigra TaxID=111844 RepID=UPI001318AF95|nr:YchJ family protein [Mannheimia pernigra]QHB16952.1 YchJ family protein [Mannheimia pernigra]